LLRKSYPSLFIKRTWTITLAVVYIIYAAVFLRTLARSDIQFRLPVYLLIEIICLVLFTLMLWRTISWSLGQHLYFGFQTLLILFLLLLNPKFDFIVVLFVLLSLEAILVFPRPIWRWWIAILILLIFLPLTVSQGMYGLALSLTPIASSIIFVAYVSVNQDIEASLHASRILFEELQTANHQLSSYAAQVEELSIIQEHNRIAREFHGSVSKTLDSIIQHNTTARQMLESNSDQLDFQLDLLQKLTQSSLEQMRELITSLRPTEKESAEQTTS
jgi:signal transduction histidine kinase